MRNPPKLRQLLGWFLLLASTCIARADEPAASPWEADIQRFEQLDRRTPPPVDPILFVGSSSVALWDLTKWFPGQPVLNRGFGGSQVSDVLKFVDRVVLAYKPRTIVFYSGDNDIASGKSSEQVAADFGALLKKIRAGLPTTRILFLATKPSPERWALVEKMRDANARIKQLGADDPGFRYVDTHTPLLGENGQPNPAYYRDDKLHLNDAGYAVWTKIVAPELDEPNRP